MPRQQTSASGAAGTSPGELRLASDEVLFEGIRDGSERHFNALYDRYFRRVYAFVHARVRDHADAEELVQESFTAVFRGIAGYSGRSTPLAWIYGIAKNTINNYRRRLRAQTDRVDAAGPEARRAQARVAELRRVRPQRLPLRSRVPQGPVPGARAGEGLQAHGGGLWTFLTSGRGSVAGSSAVSPSGRAPWPTASG